MRSHSNICKHKDAILWGAKMANELLPSSLHAEIGSFLSSVESPLLRPKGVLTCFELSESKYIESLDIDNIKTFVKWAHHSYSDRLLNACFEFIHANRTTLLKNRDFVALIDEEPELWNRIVDVTQEWWPHQKEKKANRNK